jgi:apolipoprotein N-acyltransferase
MHPITALALGIISAFAFQPIALAPLMPLAFMGLCELTSRAPSLRRALLLGWLFGLGQFAVGLNWIATAFTFQAAMPAWLGWIAVIALSLYLAIYPMLATGLAWRYGRDRPIALVLALAGGWAITEWLRATMFTGFAWNPAGVALLPTPVSRLATIVGTYGLSAILMLLAGTLLLAFHRRWIAAGSVAGAIAVATGLVALTNSAVLTAPALPIRIVQPNIGQQDKWKRGFEKRNFERLRALSGVPSRTPRLLLWPEAAVTDPLEDSRTSQHKAFTEASRTNMAALLGPNDRLLTGGFAVTEGDERTIKGVANSVIVLGPGGRVLGRYDKAHLVPYGEYLPMRPLLSAIGVSRLAPGDFDTTPGPGPRSIDLGMPWGKAGLQICYEIIFSGQVIDRNNRPGFIFNPSNDAWFGRWGPPQHLAQARLRAAEEGVPVIRSTPTGISAVIDGRGNVVKELPWRTPGAINAVLPPAANTPTLFGYLGNIIPLALGFALLIAGIVLGRRRG